MDTGQFSNILSALNQGAQAPAQAPMGLTPAQQTDNYNLFSDMMKKGIYLPDLIKRMDDLESKVRSMQESKPDVNRELFAVMEAAVKGDPDVKAAKQRVADEKSRIIAEMCQKDPRFQEALDGYRTAVNRAYIEHKEKQASDRGRAPEVCDHPSGRISHQEGMPRTQK